jgi:hypothetical protein
MKLIPEYEPIQKFFLCFVHDFFNTRFGYGKALCQIINAAHPYVDIELLIGTSEMPHFQEECIKVQTNLQNVTLNHDTPGRAIVLEYVPIFARDDNGEDVGLIFKNPWLDDAEELKHFSERMTARLGYKSLDIGFDFATAHLLVNEELVLLSDCLFQGEDRELKLKFFTDHFPSQSFHIVPPLAGDVTTDLDMYLWPIAPKAWIVSEYPANTPQADSIEPALHVLQEYQHTVHRVPGLEPIIYADINTMPNYANGVIVNHAALVPAYQRQEDDIVQGILRDYGYQVLPIDCTRVILSNSGIHCISKTVPEN